MVQELTIKIFLNCLEGQRDGEPFCPREHLLLLDGIPRNTFQCELLKPYIEVKGLIHFMCHNEETMIKRIRRRAVLENRIDDASESVTRKRFLVYHAETKPLLSYYPPEIVHNIEADRTPAEVLCDCLSHLVPVLKGTFPRKLPVAE